MCKSFCNICNICKIKKINGNSLKKIDTFTYKKGPLWTYILVNLICFNQEFCGLRNTRTTVHDHISIYQINNENLMHFTWSERKVLPERFYQYELDWLIENVYPICTTLHALLSDL